MSLIDHIKNFFYNIAGKYSTDSEAVVISCYFNPQKSPYRRQAFDKFYRSIKHLNHSIIECVIGEGRPELPENRYIKRVHAKNLLWHKESLLNLIIRDLPAKYKYIFWVDADVLFTNKQWLTEGVRQLQTNNLVQPFEYCIHLEPNELMPSFRIADWEQSISDPQRRHPNMWRSFAANSATTDFSGDTNYDRHGHVGFAWGARREILEKVPLFDKALIGGADHIIAHAAAGQIPHSCISKAFADNSDEVMSWSKAFYQAVQCRIGYVPGYLYHLWHGPLEKRQYYQRIRDFAPVARKINRRDRNGLYETEDGLDDGYMTGYFAEREVTHAAPSYTAPSPPIITDYSSEPQIYSNDTSSQTSSADAAWEGFGGGGDFAGAGAGGSWDSPDPGVSSSPEGYSGTFS